MRSWSGERAPQLPDPYAVVDPPVVLAPMAGITNLAFRQLCREQGAGIYVCEMITTQALVARNPKTYRMIEFGEQEKPRSLQLYGVDPATVRKAATEMVVRENLADHVDANFGCSVKKVTRRGGGSALPWKRQLFRQIVRAMVEPAREAGIPVTIKMRKGIDEDHLTYLEAGQIAQEEGVAAVALHARTGEQRYSRVKPTGSRSPGSSSALDIPVLGNGDIWEADDALRMMRETGCDGVVIGRGCLGRPWLFRDLANAFSGSDERTMPALGEVAGVMRRHAELLVQWLQDEREGVTGFRKHVAWYLKGFPVGTDLRRGMAMASTLMELDDLLGKLDQDAPFPADVLGKPRGRISNSPSRVILPYGWLEDRDDESVPEGAELDDSGG